MMTVRKTSKSNILFVCIC